MSAFQVVVTPTRQRQAQKISAAREPITATMAPFSAKSIIAFEDIPVTKTARRFLNICNPYPEVLKVEMTKRLKPEFNVSLDWTGGDIPANGCVTVEIAWSPNQEFCAKDSLQLTDDRHFRKDVTFIFKSIDRNKPTAVLKKATARHPIATVHLVQKKPKTNISSSPRNRKKSTELVSVPNKRFTGMSRPCESQQHGFQFTVDIKESNKRPALAVKSPFREHNVCSSRRVSPGDVLPFQNGNTMADKENLSPSSPASASALFDQICFTPASVKVTGHVDKRPMRSHDEYLASLPTPTQDKVHRASLNISQEFMQQSFESALQIHIIETPRRKTTDASMLCALDTPAVNFTNIASSTITIENVFSNTNDQTLPDIDTSSRRCLFDEHPPNKTYNVRDHYESPKVSPYRQSISPASPSFGHMRCPSPAPSLCMIPEEDSASDRSACIQKTFNISTVISTHDDTATDLLQDINLVGTPLRKKYQSMRDLNLVQKQGKTAALKDNQGSMPNLHQIVKMKPIENNRYFYKSLERDHQRDLEQLNSSITSVASVQFRETEILAQSSQFNINRCHEPGSSTSSGTYFFDGVVDSSSTKRSNFRMPTSISAPKTHIIKRPIPRIERTSPSPKSSLSKRGRDESVAARRRISDKFSPPKRARIETSSTSGSHLFRSSSSSPEIRRKSFNCSMTNTSSSFNSTKNQSTKFKMPKFPVQKLTLKRQQEDRIFLYDAEIHIQGVINPDPFAATTTCDPFLAATMYLDQNCVEKHEEHFKKWLNALVTIPSDLDFSPHKKIDFGALFNDVRNKEVSLAQPKEVVSSNYFTKYRLDGLRRAAIKLYLSEEMRVPLEKLVVHIERQYIFMRADRDLHLDMVLQRDILELLLCFNPLWLRLGLEVIYGELINMQNNADILSLSTFIVTRLFRDCYMEAKHHRSYTRSEEYAAYIKKFTLKKVLMLLLFLDTAKDNRIVTHNPCLFLKTSEYKDVKSILLRFTSTMLANLGDVQRDLRRIGITFSHKQTYLDEFDYAFRNLAVDLRDGVRLTRVMEIILMRDDLAQKLRVPAISRLQRVFNVDLALKALADADYDITGHITAADIADGHREKTLSLLWQIIYKFRAPKFKAAAIVLQSWWRRSWLRVCIQRRIRHKEHLRRIRAIIVIQAAFRGYIARQYCKIYRAERTAACLRLQSATRRYLAMRHYRLTMSCVVCIQRWYRQTKLAKQTRQRFATLRQAAICIQRRYRKVMLAKRLEGAAMVFRQLQNESRKRNESAVVLQQRFRATISMRLHRQEFLTLKAAVNLCQQRFRAILLMRTERTEYCKRRTAAITIQRHYRSVLYMRITQSQYIRQRTAVVTLQRYVRAFLIGRRVHRDFVRTKQAILKIQSWYRAHVSRRREQQRFTVVRQACVVVQRRFRATIHMRLQQVAYQRLKRAAIVMQMQFRSLLAMQAERKRYHSLRSAVISVQRLYRANAAMRVQRGEFLKLRSAVITVQDRFRANRNMLEARINYHDIRNATLCCQQRYRAQISMKIERCNYIRLQSGCLVIQRHFRAFLAGRQQRQALLLFKEAAIIIQRKLRATLLMRRQRADYTRFRQVVVVVQRRFRAKLLGNQMRSHYDRLRWAALVFQHRFRSRKRMQAELAQFTVIKKSACVILTRWRAQLTMRADRQRFLLLKQMTIRIQQRFRATRIMRKERKRFLLIRTSTIIIQRFYTATLCMRRQRDEYLRLRDATLLVQRQFRANKLAKQQREEYLWIRTAAVKVQRFFRGFSKMRKDTNDYKRLQTVTRTIQIHFRGHLQRKMQRVAYLKLRASCICIQRRFRAKLAMRTERNRYQELKAAAITIQRRFRANKLAKQQRECYVKMLHATRVVQQRFRAQISMRQERAKYIRIHQATIVIQRHFRSHQLARTARSNYLHVHEMVIRIQRKVRATIAMQHQLLAYTKLNSAVLRCQRQFRANQAMRRERQHFQQQQKAARCLQQRYRALVTMRIERHRYVRLQWAVRICQRRFRANLLMMEQRSAFLCIRSTIISCQRRFRGMLLTKKLRMEFLSIKRSVLTIQQRYRANQLMKVDRNKYVVNLKRIRFIQTTFRAKITMRKYYQRYQSLRSTAIRIQRRFRAVRVMRTERQRFLQLRATTVLIQRKYKSILLMRRDYSAFQSLRVATIRIQQRFRAQMAMRFDRVQFITLKCSTIQIQRRFRAQQQMLVTRKHFQRKKAAAICIQRRFRSYLMMRRQRALFIAQRSTIIRFQQRFRARQQMKVDRHYFTQLRLAALIIQRRFRANRLARQIAAQYKLIRCLVVCVQRKFRANRAMRLKRSEFCGLRECAVFLQQKFRGHRLMLEQRKKFLNNKQTIISLQARIRGFIARRNYQAKCTPQMLEQKRQQKAVRNIQKVWRGFEVRRKETTKMKIIREKVKKVNKNVQPQNKLRNRITYAMKMLKGRYNISDALNVLNDLVKISREVPQTLLNEANFIGTFCYDIMSQAIRSEPDKQLIELCSKVILNLARYEPTRRQSFKKHGLITVAQMLLRWCDKESYIFNTLCTVIWVYSHCADMRKIIRDYMTTHEALYMLVDTKRLVIRKENMRRNRTPNAMFPILTPQQRRQMPFLKPDYGLTKRATNQVYIFNCSIFAFDTIMQRLDILVKHYP